MGQALETRIPVSARPDSVRFLFDTVLPEIQCETPVPIKEPGSHRPGSPRVPNEIRYARPLACQDSGPDMRLQICPPLLTIDLHFPKPILTAAALYWIYPLLTPGRCGRGSSCTRFRAVCSKEVPKMVSFPELIFYGGATLAVVFLVWVLFKLVQDGRQ